MILGVYVLVKAADRFYYILVRGHRTTMSSDLGFVGFLQAELSFKGFIILTASQLQTFFVVGVSSLISSVSQQQ